jgi:hypothetical protein
MHYPISSPPYPPNVYMKSHFSLTTASTSTPRSSHTHQTQAPDHPATPPLNSPPNVPCKHHIPPCLISLDQPRSCALPRASPRSSFLGEKATSGASKPSLTHGALSAGSPDIWQGNSLLHGAAWLCKLLRSSEACTLAARR